MEEAYCSYEVSKLLKKNGFDGRTYKIYRPNGRGSTIGWVATNTRLSNHEFLCNCITRPTLQMACAWLREKHLIHVYAEHKAFFQEKKPKKLYYHWMPFVKTLPHCQINKSGFPKDTISLDVYCDTYEEAVGAALKYTLENLI